MANRIVDRTFGRTCSSFAPDGGASGAGAAVGDDAGSGGASGTNENGGSITSCDGQCVVLNGSSSVCSRRCVFGDVNECAPASGGLRRGACAFVTPGGSIGDLGYCAELCDCNDDCIEPTFSCDAFDDAVLEKAFGRKGACTEKTAAQHSLLCTQ